MKDHSMGYNVIELRHSKPYGLGAYASKDYNNPTDLHVKYKWSDPPSVINANENVTIKLEQEVISNKTGNFGVRFSPYFKLDAADLKLWEEL